jgi:ribose transport system ATP-binding protein
MGDVVVKMGGIGKSFPGVRALDNVQFELQSGEVHALVGENGAGKSTLMKVLAGVHSKDAGHIIFRGNEVEIPSPRAALNLGISMIHQELNLLPHLTVAQNIFLGREPRRSISLMLDEKELNERARELLAMLRLRLNPRAKVADLTVARQQMVEIAKALSFNAAVVIMDEPTAALTDTEISELFRIIRHLRDEGVGIVHISHRLEELKQISDRITVMRDGRYVDTVRTADATTGEIIRMMVGRTIYESTPEVPEKPSQEVVLEVRHLARERVLDDINLRLKRGEIVGVAGLVGAGRTEMARAIFGADPVDSGEIYVNGHKVEIRSPHDAVKHGIGYLSEDRKRFGLVLNLDVATNVVLAAFSKFVGVLGRVDRARIRATAEHFIRALSIRTPGPRQQVKNLSGGTQQKVVVAKWLTADSDILIFDEPTRGIDVGAKSEIYRLLNDLARQGKSVMMISSELPEILRMSHRVVVMCEGRITGELPIREASQENIMTLATQRRDLVRAGDSSPTVPRVGGA